MVPEIWTYCLVFGRKSHNLCPEHQTSNTVRNEHFKGPKGLISALNKRTFIIRRIKNQIPLKNTMRVVQSIWMSKLRYGLQLCNKVRTMPSDPTSNNMQAAQVAQNKMLRMLNGSSKTEHITSKSLLEKFNLPSVNQLAAEIKLIEAWKIMNVPEYPISLDSNNPTRNTGDRIVRDSTTVGAQIVVSKGPGILGYLPQ